MRVGEIDVPEPEDSYESLAAWYSSFQFYEVYRKVCLAACREIIRAGSHAQGMKLSEAKIDDKAHTKDEYLSYLAKHLRGRMKWEKEFLAQGGFK